jgi:hypothetical protein
MTNSNYDQWEQHWGFKALSPFRENSADREQLLSGYFYAPQFWGDVVRDVSHVIHGPWGSGKTAICQTLMGRFVEAPKVLVLLLDQFEDLRDREISSHEVVDRIIATGVMALVKELRKRHGLKLSRQESDNLISLVAGYHHPATPDAFVADLLKVTTVRRERSAVALTRRGWLRFRLFMSMRIRRAAAVSRAATTEGSPSERITAMRAFGKAVYSLLGSFQEPASESRDPAVRISPLVEAARAFGFERIVILADRFDDLTNAHSDYVLMAKIASPFFALAAMHLHRMSNLTFKFHVPTGLLSHSDFRRDKLEVHALKWSDKQMLEMLAARLSYASYKRIGTVEELIVAEERGDFVKVLLAYAAGIPRHMYRILNYATLALCELDDPELARAPSGSRARTPSLPGVRQDGPPRAETARAETVRRLSRYALSLTELASGVRAFYEKEKASPWLTDHATEARRRLQEVFEDAWEHYAVSV